MSTEHQCEAKVKHRVVQQGRTDGLHDLSGQRITLPEGIKETPTVEETTIECPRCDIQKVFNTTGMGFAAYNEANRQAQAFFKANCGKWQKRVDSGSVKGEMPDDLLPK